MIASKLLRAVPIAAVVVIWSVSAAAGNLNSFLSPNGSDTNNCGPNDPCRLLHRALPLTLPGGKIIFLGSANYKTGKEIIDHPLSLIADPGIVATLVATGGDDALDINIPPGTTGGVTLRNLVFQPFGSSFKNGVTLQSDTSLTIDNCLFEGPLANAVEWIPVHKDSIFPPSGPGVVIQNSQISGANGGIVVSPGATGTEISLLTVTDTTISNVAGDGIQIASGGTFNLDHVRLIGNGSSLSGNGIEIATPGVTQIGAHISNSVISGFDIGVHATQTAPTPHVGASISWSVIKDSGTAVQSNGARIVLDSNQIVNNGKGVTASPASAVASTGNNTFDNNQTADDPFGTAPHK